MLTTIHLDRRARARASQTMVGLSLAVLVIVAFMSTHIAAIFLIDWRALPLALAVLMVLVQTWLFVGLFIIAHDCMHGSLAPGRPWVNRTFGRMALLLYAGFSYDRLLPEHHKHHRRPGTDADPDYNPSNPHAFWPWFARFLRHYYGLREFLTMGTILVIYVLVLAPPIPNLVVFFALPALLSAMQLFYFGTYRPHRHGHTAFADEHNTRTDHFPWLVSLLTCFHFGYHHEHHLSPTTPWWRLPKVRAEHRKSGSIGKAAAVDPD